MSVVLDPYTIPEKGKVELKVDRSFEIKVTAEEAQRNVRRWLREEISLLLDADPPVLVVGEQVVWRVPAWIGFPQSGRAGIVGIVDVEVTTGVMNNTPECKAELERQAEATAAQQPPYYPHETLAAPYLTKNVPPAPKLSILADGAVAPLSPTQTKPR